MAQTMFSDEGIKYQVLEELKWVPEVEPTDVGVQVDNGVVTLTGTVESYPMKFAAERAAHRVKGVTAVANNIQVALPYERMRTDTDIAAAAVNALGWDTEVPDGRIRVTVRDGWVTLEGDVAWHFQRQAAERDIHSLTGVKGVSNLIDISVVAPAPDPGAVRLKIEEALKRNAELGSERIKVETRDGEVTLSGAVRSWVEREDAEKAVWSASGVKNVVNRITIAPWL